MPSAAFASRDWRQSQYWGRHADVSFADVRRAALGALATALEAEEDSFWSAAADAADAAAAAHAPVAQPPADARDVVQPPPPPAGLPVDDSSSDDELEIVY